MNRKEDIEKDLRKALIQDGLKQQACEEAANNAGWKEWRKSNGISFADRTNRVKIASLAAYKGEYCATKEEENSIGCEYEDMLKHAEVYADYVSTNVPAEDSSTVGEV